VTASEPAAGEPTPLVSIVVAARDEASAIERCLAALRTQTYPADRLEILVADGMSTDGTRDIVARIVAEDPRVRLVDNPERVTPTAFNAGLRAATGTVLGIMSGHGAADQDYVRQAIDILRETGAWAVGGRIDRTASTPTQRAIALATSSPFGVGDATHNYATVAGPAETVFPGMWPREVLERVGLFDPELVRNQDDELSYRIRAAGGQIWYDPRLVVAYEPRGSIGGLFRQYRQYGMWKIRVFQKHHGAVRPRQVVPAAWVGTMVGGLVVGVVWPVGLVIAGAALASYAVVMTVAGVRMPGRDVPVARVVAALAALHLGYGIGMWHGLVRFAGRWGSRQDGGSSVPRLTAPGQDPSA
jgi:GT2 family glycosyltransferase